MSRKELPCLRGRDKLTSGNSHSHSVDASPKRLRGFKPRARPSYCHINGFQVTCYHSRLYPENCANRRLLPQAISSPCFHSYGSFHTDPARRLLPMSSKVNRTSPRTRYPRLPQPCVHNCHLVPWNHLHPYIVVGSVSLSSRFLELLCTTLCRPLFRLTEAYPKRILLDPSTQHS